MNWMKQELTAVPDIAADISTFQHYMQTKELVPFGPADSTVGMEYELQVAVEGSYKDVDLPLTVASSTFFKNIAKRTARGDLSSHNFDSLKDFLFQQESAVWENSWVRFSEHRLTAYTRKLLAVDFLADKAGNSLRKRSDVYRFRCTHRGRELLRLPISYLLKLSLANALSIDSSLPKALLATGKELMEHFLSDNTSPEILSFSIQSAKKEGVGNLAAAESLRTLLFSQLLLQYANKSFGLEASGQKCLLYCAPHAPSRQKELNDIVPDSFYRQLFMSPCLNGWDKGEEKHRYMGLCHSTLSRSQLNTISKLKDAGIITNNLVVLPNTSNTCLANNGTHVSLGSSSLSRLAASLGSPFTPEVEKYFGDLVIKIVEHFLPLFVNSYSAAPRRIDFADFHPEKVLGFLPHMLDYTHLRMIWRRWKKKADLRFFGRTVTPFGPRWIDGMLAKSMGLKGDIIPDFRLIDYLVTLLSTETSPALSGVMGNQERLKEELAHMGVFDSRMPLYLLYRQRIARDAGYAGFEGRSYSLFHSIQEDMAEAVDMQNLITSLAYRYVISGTVTGLDIPDKPSIESERRQIFFTSAIGIPTFYVRRDTGNRFLKKILTRVRSQRNSLRYKGYIRVKLDDYKLALLEVIVEDGEDLVDSMHLYDRVTSLRGRLSGERDSSYSKIITGVQGELQGNKRPLKVDAEKFNLATEKYYRTTLKQLHLEEGLAVLIADCERLEKEENLHLREVMQNAGIDQSAASFVARCRIDIRNESLVPETLLFLIRVSLAVIHATREKQ